MRFEIFNPADIAAAAEVAREIRRAELQKALRQPVVTIIGENHGWPAAGHFVLNPLAVDALRAYHPEEPLTHVNLCYVAESGHIGIMPNYRPASPTALPLVDYQPAPAGERVAAAWSLDNAEFWTAMVDARPFMAHYGVQLRHGLVVHRCTADLTAGPTLVFHPTRTI